MFNFFTRNILVEQDTKNSFNAEVDYLVSAHAPIVIEKVVSNDSI